MASKRKISLMRQAQTAATAKYGLGGLIKKRPPKPITLAKRVTKDAAR